jgi:hypothetical protein
VALAIKEMSLSTVSHGVDLYWLPIGGGGHFVRWNGRVYEALVSARQRRDRRDLYHSALEVTTPDGVYAIEMAPAITGGRRDSGAVAGGAVGSRLLGRSRLFRYEIRCGLGAGIPDVEEAVESPRRIGSDPRLGRQLLELVPRVPTPVWGRDQLRAGEMWNSNSVISWLLTCAGVDAATVSPPGGGRAPGWDAGIAVAALRIRAGLAAG